MTPKLKLFISYSHKDENYKEEITSHLSALINNGIITEWNDRKITPGERWDDEVKSQLSNSDIILFLVSHHFIASDYINNVEIKLAFERYEKGETLIVPVVVSACDFASTNLSKFQSFPKDLKPIESWDKPNEAYFNVIQGIKKLINEFPFNNAKAKTAILKIEENLYECDQPPKVEKFTGRVKELSLISNAAFKVVYITGIGGQGKSTLASYFIQNYLEKLDYEFWDWRDCKEENNRIITKIISLIERLSDGVYSPSKLNEATSKDLIDILFKEIGERKIIFVFDNIDSYIDLNDFLPVGILKLLLDESVVRIHSCKFIFTCRPFVKYAGIDFFQISLSSLNYLETTELFNKHNVPFVGEQKEQIIEQVHSITKGHPLWISLLAAQAQAGIETIQVMLQKIEKDSYDYNDNITHILSENILTKVYNKLNQKQQIMLRGLAEAVKAESSENFKKLISSELNYNQATKALRTLKYFNLLVFKSTSNGDLVELHPLVKQFIRTKYPRQERSKFITFFVNYYDSLIVVLKKSLSSNLPLSSYENWTSKLELEVNNNNLQSALNTIHEVRSAMVVAGYIEEYLRAASLLFNKIDFLVAIAKEYTFFNTELQSFIDVSITFGQFKEARFFIDKFRESINDKNSNHLLLLGLEIYYYWFQGQFEKAIYWGARSETLINEMALSDNYNVTHNFGLALRDSRKSENLNKALKIFLKGEDLKEILEDELGTKNLTSNFYGNIGRTLWFMGKIDQALVCFVKSFLLIRNEHSENTHANKGYPSYWIGEALYEKKDYPNAYLFYRNAKNFWEKHSPPRAKKVIEEVLLLEKRIANLEYLNNLDDFVIESKCIDWAQKN